METISQAGAAKAFPPHHIVPLGRVYDSSRPFGYVSSTKPVCPRQSPRRKTEGIRGLPYSKDREGGSLSRSTERPLKCSAVATKGVRHETSWPYSFGHFKHEERTALEMEDWSWRDEWVFKPYWFALNPISISHKRNESFTCVVLSSVIYRMDITNASLVESQWGFLKIKYEMFLAEKRCLIKVEFVSSW